MRRFLRSIARPAIRRLAPLTFIKSAALRENPKFLTFLNLGMTFDHATAAADIESLVESRTNWSSCQEESLWQDHSQEAKLGFIRELLFSLVENAVAEILPGKPVYLGLSGGLDSRSILHVLNVRGIAVKPYTFGQPGNRDFDIVREYVRRTGQESTMFDTNRLDWRLKDFVAADFFQDLPLSPRVVAHTEIERHVGPRIEWNGFANDRLTGAYHREKQSATWAEALTYFEKTHDVFHFQRFFPPAAIRSYFPERPIVTQQALNFDDQVGRGYSGAQRIKPCDGPGVTFVLPYTDWRWQGFWLNRGASERFGRKLYIAAVRSLNAPEFFDLSSGGATTMAEYREQQLRLLYGPRYKELGRTPISHDNEKIVYPIGPAMHFCLVSCYANNAGFRKFVELAIQGVRDLGIFEDAFVQTVMERFHAGSREGIKMMGGLISTYIQYRCGRFTA